MMTSMHTKPELYPGLPITQGMLIPTDRTLPPVPLKHTDIQASIIGPLCSVQIEQTFHNTHTRPIEAIYVFPLPEDAAVTDLSMTIGDRQIRGEIREREQAQQTYTEARDAGKGAALLEQERPNIFTVSVANIQPDQQIEVVLRFHDQVHYENGAFEFVLPTVVLPRYVPPEATPDARRITATPLLPEETCDGHTLSINVALDVGKLHSITSPSHDIEVVQQRGTATITLRRADTIPNKDFILRYAVADKQFQTATFTYRPAGQPGTALLMLTPQVELVPEDIVPRELLFVFDRSGSMMGDSIVQARNALHGCLRALNPGDRFNIFPFNSGVEQFAPESLSFCQEHVDRADAYIDQIEASGGTNILAALQRAMQQPRDSEYLRVIVFMTDGAVGNEDQVLRELSQYLNESRVYAFGIGSSVNRFLLDKLAEVGRGTVEYIFPGQAIEDAVQRFQNRAAFPVLVDLKLDWGSNHVTDVYPNPLPDLYSGQPVVVLARFHGSGISQAKLTGCTPHGVYEQMMQVEWPDATPDRSDHWIALTQVWARARLDALMRSERNDTRRTSQLRDEIIGLALEHRLLSPYTALVAVDEQDAHGRDKAERVIVPIHLPQGTRREAFEEPRFDTFGAPSPSPYAASGTLLSAIPEIAAPRPVQHMAERVTAAGSRLFQAFAASQQGTHQEGTPRSQVPGQHPAAISTAERYNAALRYLARTQGVSGAWSESQVATALVVLAFLCGGHTDRMGNFRPQLTRALRWLMEQAQNVQVAPVVAWALAEVAVVTGADAHIVAREAALASTTPPGELNQAIFRLAQLAETRPLQTDPHIPHADIPINDQTLGDEQHLLELTLQVWQYSDAANSAGSALSPYQVIQGSNSGALPPPGHTVTHPDSLLFTATAVAALAWGKSVHGSYYLV